MTLDDKAQIGREYLRVSVDRSGRERSPEEQTQDNQRAATTRRWLLGKAYRDVGSASRYASKAREGFDKLLVDLEKNRFGAQILILWESSRGSRRVSEWVRLLELCEQRGVRIYVTSDGKLYDPGDPRDRRSLLEDSVDAEYESAKVSKRAKRAQSANAAAGMPNGRTPFGYRRLYDPVTRRFVAQEPEPAEAKVIKQLFDRLHKGHALRRIAIDFETAGFRSRTGKVFSAQHLRSLARTRAYIGEREHTPGRHDRHGTAGETAYTKAVWPAIVTKAKFLAVQRNLSAPERVTTRPGRAVHLLSMIARCDQCGGPLTVRNDPDREPSLNYVCHKGYHLRIDYQELNDLAEQVMIGYLSRKDNVERLTAKDDGGEQLQAVRDEIAAIREEHDDLVAQVSAGKLSATFAARSEPGILKRLKEAEAREQELSTPSELRSLITPGKDVARRWKATPMEVKRKVARILLAHDALGELRVTRAPSRGHRGPVEERVTWRREP